uniref:Photosystem II 5 kDa protein, chloroplastic n=1 Tax=Picea sitchensis TaxID=3332 RepID=A9NRW9_PICSI|nr:unknown [Picea sitchensis]
MASLSLCAPCNISSASSLAAGYNKVPCKSVRGGAQVGQVFMVNKSFKSSQDWAVHDENVTMKKKEDDQERMQRRRMMFTAAAAAVSAAASQGMMAMAAGEKPTGPEPKRGTPEAKKLYARVCVTMPTASVCHN